MKRKFKNALVGFFLLLALLFFAWKLAFVRTGNHLAPDIVKNLLEATDFEVLALNPNSVHEGSVENTNTILGYPILERAEVSNEMRRNLVGILSEDIAKSAHPPSACILIPHHGIRSVSGTNIINIAICYKCGDVMLSCSGKTNFLQIKSESFPTPNSKKLIEKCLRERVMKP